MHLSLIHRTATRVRGRVLALARTDELTVNQAFKKKNVRLMKLKKAATEKLKRQKHKTGRMPKFFI
jgi:hypothetical protein